METLLLIFNINQIQIRSLTEQVHDKNTHTHKCNHSVATVHDAKLTKT